MVRDSRLCSKNWDGVELILPRIVDIPAQGASKNFGRELCLRPLYLTCWASPWTAMDPDRKRNIARGVKRAWEEGKMDSVSESNRRRWEEGTRKPRDADTGRKISEALRKQYESGARAKSPWFASKSVTERAAQGKAAQVVIPKGAKHPTARWWDIRDPSGRMHRFRNLNQFLRDHPELFDPEDLVMRGRSCRAAKGIQSMFLASQPAGSWKGWTPAMIWHDDVDPLERTSGARRLR